MAPAGFPTYNEYHSIPTDLPLTLTRENDFVNEQKSRLLNALHFIYRNRENVYKHTCEVGVAISREKIEGLRLDALKSFLIEIKRQQINELQRKLEDDIRILSS